MKNTKMKLFIISYCFSLLMIQAAVSEIRSVQTSVTDNNWSSPKEMLLPSSEGNVRAVTRSSSSDWNGKHNMLLTQVVFVPTNGILWIGKSCQHLFVMKDKIVGVYPRYGGRLFLQTSSTRISKAGIIHQRHELDKYLRDYRKQFRAENQGGGNIRLRTIVGRGALIDIRRADGPKPVQITSVSFDKSNVVLTMKSGIGKTIVLTLNKDMDCIMATVEGEVVFQKGKINPPTFREELMKLRQEEKQKAN